MFVLYRLTSWLLSRKAVVAASGASALVGTMLGTLIVAGCSGCSDGENHHRRRPAIEAIESPMTNRKADIATPPAPSAETYTETELQHRLQLDRIQQRQEAANKVQQEKLR